MGGGGRRQRENPHPTAHSGRNSGYHPLPPPSPVLDTGLGFPASLSFGMTPGWKRAVGFTSWRTARLVYAERHDAIEPAIAREKLVKKWRREWKFALIEADNPDWLDLWGQWHPPGEVLKLDGEG